MPRFNPDPSKVSSGFPILPKGDYEIALGSAKPFVTVETKEEQEVIKNYGIRYASRVASGEKKGTIRVISLYMHSEGGQSFSKQYQLAAYGLNPADPSADNKFNEEFGGLDWSFNTDDGTVGEGWKRMEGKVIKESLSVKKDDEDKEQQEVKAIRPV